MAQFSGGRRSASRLLFSSSNASRGQVTLELLVLFVVIVVVLGVVASAIGQIQKTGQAAAQRSMLQLAADDVAHAADEACLLGPGNARSVALRLPQVAIASSGSTLVFTAGGQQASSQTRCTVNVNGNTFSGSVPVKYVPGGAQIG